MRSATLVLLVLLAACASGRKDVPLPADDPGRAPGEPLVVQARDFPEEITGLLTAAEADSCGVCIREKRAEAFTIARAWFAPGNRVSADGTPGWRVLSAADQELTFAAADDDAPRLTFRFHTAEEHLVGVDEGDFTDAGLAAAVLARPPGERGHDLLEVVAFDYGEGPGFRFDAARNRIQVQVRVLGPRSSRFGPVLRGESAH